MAKFIYHCDFCGVHMPNIHNRPVSHLVKEHSLTCKESLILIKKQKEKRYKNHISKNTGHFIDNKYTKLYFKMVNAARNITYDCYTEKHHIIPKSMNGSDILENVITISAREHYILHLLLTRMIEKSNPCYYKMASAHERMVSGHNSGLRYNSSTMQLYKKQFSKAHSINQSGESNSQYGTIWVHHLEYEKSIKIKKDQYMNYSIKGWNKGRVIVFNNYKNNLLPKIVIPKLQEYRDKNKLNNIIPPDTPESIVNMLKAPTVMGFDYLAEDLEKEVNDFKEFLYHLYYIDQWTFDGMKDHFGLSIAVIDRLYSEYGIPKISMSEISFRNSLAKSKDGEKIKFIRECKFAFDINKEPKVINQNRIYESNNGRPRLKHLISPNYAWNHNISSDLISHPANCILTFIGEKSIIGDCLISKETLMKRINLWESDDPLTLQVKSRMSASQIKTISNTLKKNGKSKR